MVAPRSTTAHASEHPPADTRPASVTTARFHQEPDSFTRYNRAWDQDVAKFDAGSGTAHLIVQHECFVERSQLTEAEQMHLEIKQAALRIACGLESRSLRTLAKHIGCSKSALDNCVLRIFTVLNMRKFHVSDTTRQRQSEARRKQLAASR